MAEGCRGCPRVSLGAGPSERMGKENETKASRREDRNEASPLPSSGVSSSTVHFLLSVATPGCIGM